MVTGYIMTSLLRVATGVTEHTSHHSHQWRRDEPETIEAIWTLLSAWFCFFIVCADFMFLCCPPQLSTGHWALFPWLFYWRFVFLFTSTVRWHVSSLHCCTTQNHFKCNTATFWRRGSFSERKDHPIVEQSLGSSLYTIWLKAASWDV